MSYDQLAHDLGILTADVRAKLRDRPGVTVVEDAVPFMHERRQRQRVQLECGECGKIIRAGGTTVRLELCATCSTNLER